MPEPPDVNLFTRYVLENPWPLGMALLAVAAWLAWSGMSQGLMKKVKLAAVAATAGAAVLLAGMLVVTSGEHAKTVTRALVDAAVNGDPIAAVALFSPGAAFAVGSPKNPGMGFDFIQDQMIRLLDRYKVDSNNITMLRSYSESSTAATVHLACFTEVNGFPYPNASRWVLRVQRQTIPTGPGAGARTEAGMGGAEGRGREWKIVHLTCVDINNQTPPLSGVR